MFVLTKRTAPSDRGNVMHSIHGHTSSVQVARAWFRSTRTTDVVECVDPDCIRGGVIDLSLMVGRESEAISDSRFPSWREQQLHEELQIAELRAFSDAGRCAK